MTKAMAQETEGVLLPSDGVARGISVALSGRASAPQYWVATSEEGEEEGEGSREAAPNNAVVGLIGIAPEWSDWWGCDYWWITAVYVKKTHRRRGICKALLERVNAEARRRSVQCVMLRVEKDNVAAQRVYSSAGFEVDDSHHVMSCGRTPAGEEVGVP